MAEADNEIFDYVIENFDDSFVSACPIGDLGLLFRACREMLLSMSNFFMWFYEYGCNTSTT